MSVIHGDCLDVMAGMEPESVDAIVTDPPYDLSTIGRTLQVKANLTRHDKGPNQRRESKGFMGKAWDGTGIAFRSETWAAALRVAKPSAYLLAFGGTRTVHRMTCAIEDAGWIVRDMLVWAYASGFPKSKASLKPAWEPIVMARKPGPLRMLAIDECRIGFGSEQDAADAEFNHRGGERGNPRGAIHDGGVTHQHPSGFVPAGRWPANVVLTDPIFDGGWDGVVGGGETGPAGTAVNRNREPGTMTSWMGTRASQTGDDLTYGDTGTYSRFFLIPKSSRSDREPVLGGLEPREARTLGNKAQGPLPQQTPYVPAMRANHHPTVKPVDLMRHLVRLVTPPGGTVLDPFGGSGTTALACEQEGFPWVLIEREAEYVAIAEARLNGTQRGLGLEAS